MTVLCWPHDWEWEPMTTHKGVYVQYAHCRRCRKTKVKEVLL